MRPRLWVALLVLSAGVASAADDWYQAYDKGLKAIASRQWDEAEKQLKENGDKMQSGSLFQVAEVLKSLLELQTDKPLSFREKKMLDRARHMLVTEVSIARGLPQFEAESLLDKALQKAGLSLPAVL